MALTGGRTNFADPLELGTELRIPYAPLRMDAFWAITNTLNNAGSFASVVQVSVLLPGEIHPGEGTPTEKAGTEEGRSEGEVVSLTVPAQRRRPQAGRRDSPSAKGARTRVRRRANMEEKKASVGSGGCLKCSGCQDEDWTTVGVAGHVSKGQAGSRNHSSASEKPHLPCPSVDDRCWSGACQSRMQ